VRISDPRGRSVRLSEAVIAVLAGMALLAPAAGAVVAKVKPLKIGPSELKLATATVPYKHQLTANGGTAPYTFTLQEGTPPPGITLSPAGEVSGTPTEAGSSTFTVLATDSSTPAMTATRTYTVGVQLDVTPKSIKHTRVSALVDVGLSTAGGSGSYEISLVSGALPEGVKLYAEFFQPKIYGGATTAGDYTFTIQARDTSSGAIGTRTYKLHVGLAVNPAYQFLPDAYIEHPYNQWYQAEGGSQSYTYSVSAGTLPEGLELTPNGTLEASLVDTPTKPEVARFTITAKDTETGLTGEQKYYLRVRANSFPRDEFVLEEKDHEGAFRGRDTLTFVITRELHGMVSGFMHDPDRTFGTWTYNPTTHHIHLQWPEESGPTGSYNGTCEPVAETCSGEDPFGTFTLARKTGSTL
jgi:hypothetical protein